MTRAFPVRGVARIAAAVATSLTVAACGRGNKPPHVDTTPGPGVIDSAPATAAKVVAAVIGDQNIFAELDTAYADIIQTDSLAQAKSPTQAVKDFAGNAVSRNSLARSGARAEAQRLRVPPVLPDHPVIKDHAKVMQQLGAASGKDFDKAYLDRVIDARKDLADHIDKALNAQGVQPAVKKFLGEVKQNLEADIKNAQDLKAKNG